MTFSEYIISIKSKTFYTTSLGDIIKCNSTLEEWFSQEYDEYNGVYKPKQIKPIMIKLDGKIGQLPMADCINAVLSQTKYIEGLENVYFTTKTSILIDEETKTPIDSDQDGKNISMDTLQSKDVESAIEIIADMVKNGKGDTLIVYIQGDGDNRWVFYNDGKHHTSRFALI